jgi:hypothetical protein
MPVLYIGVEFMYYPDIAGRFSAAAVAGQADEIYFHRKIEPADKVGQENKGTLEDSDNQGRFILVFPGNIRGYPVDSGFDFLTGDETVKLGLRIHT